MSDSMESEDIYIEYRKIWDEIKALRRDVHELKEKNQENSM